MSWNVSNKLELVKWFLVMTVLILLLTYLYITHSMLSIYADGGVEDVLKSQCLLHVDSIAANNYGTYIYVILLMLLQNILKTGYGYSWHWNGVMMYIAIPTSLFWLSAELDQLKIDVDVSLFYQRYAGEPLQRFDIYFQAM